MQQTKDPGTAQLPQWSSQGTTREGVKLNIRPANSSDERPLVDFFDRVRPQDLRFRFLSAIKAIWPRLAYDLANIDHVEMENLLAFDDGGELVASAIITTSDRDKQDAEVAITVRSDLKEHGIGWTMLERATDYARSRGFKRLHSVQQSDDRAAIALQEEMGFRPQPGPHDMSVTILSKEL
ncbi:MAG TPA: GNAT family N-acetyltransferase [Sphingomicrobium sp.]